MPPTLHLLTPQSRQSPTVLVEAGLAAAGHQIADFRSFPPLAYLVQSDGSRRDITADLHGAPDYWAVTREWLERLAAQTGLQKLLAVDGHGIWWTLDALKFTPGVADLGNVFAWIDLLRAVHRTVSLQRLVLYGQNESLDGILAQVLPGVTVERAGGELSQPPRPRERLSRIWLYVARVLLGIVYLIYACVRRPQIWFFSSTALLRAERVGKKQVLRDVYLGEVAQALRGRGWRTAVVEHHGVDISWPALRVRGFFFPHDLLLLLAFLRLRLPVIGRRATRYWRARWAQLQPTLAPYLQYQGVDLASLVLPVLRRAFFRDAPLVEGLVGLWRLVLRLGRPRLFYINCSYSLWAVPIIIAARSLGILTAEQQHGVIAASHRAYVVPESLRTQVRVPWCDRMVVWGEHTRRILAAAGSYRPEHLAVCGFPRMDALLRGLPSREDTLTRLGIPVQSKVVLYTSNMIVGDLYPQILASLQAVSTAPIYWIVKLHPREQTRSRWEQAVGELGLEKVRLVENEVDFYALLAACDLHVSFVSTTLIEAAALGKPNLGLSWTSVTDPVAYAEAGAYMPVAPQRLGETAWRVLQDQVLLQALGEEQQRFADDWCRHDGSSVRCIVEFIESLMGVA